MLIVSPNSETRKITTVVTDLEKRMRAAEAGLRAAQLKNSSITDGGLNIYDDNGVIRTVLGKQEDGSYTAISTNNPLPPPVPAAPIVSPALASAIVKHTGETQSGVGWPADLKALNIYYALVQNPDDWQAGGSLGTSWPEELPIAPLEYTDYLVAVTAINHSGKESEKSEPVSVSPKQVVPNDLIADIFTGLELSEGVVTEAALAAGAVTKTKIADDSIESPKIVAGAVLGMHIAADQIDGGKLTAQAITSRELRALAVIAGKIDVNAVTAGTIAAGAVTATKLEANLVISNRFIAGSLTGNRVEMHPLQGLQAYTGNGAIRTFWIDAATGNAFLMGQIATAGSGERIVMNPGGNNPNRIQFWPAGANTFAYIDCFSEGSSAAGITMQASSSGTQKVGTVWLRQAYAQLGMADSSLTSGSQFYAEPSFVRARSATIDLMCDQAIAPVGGPRRVAFLNVNTANQPVANSSLFYGTATANQYPIFYKPEFNLGLIFDGGGYLAVVRNDASYTRATIEAGEFRVSSDSRGKRQVRDFEFSALETVTRNPSRQWRRKKPGRPMGATSAPQKAVGEDSNGDTIFEDNVTPQEDPWFFGPMADNLPDSMVYVNPDTESRSVGLTSLVGVLWKAVEELSAEVTALREERNV